ncbi:MAG TPA: NAD(P)/FAD-dependent oxidoreductase [Thermoanaerobaculia bacterium]|nr:NAD(P)/FAD-dependent oxidoreductase [Thermoanaerobaculia bacterium]
MDAVVVGAGPNGLSAAITLAQAGRSVLLVEGEETVGGAARAAELTLPGFTHDVCSAIYPLTVGSPYLKTLPLGEHGLRWIHPTVAMAHPLDNGTAAVLSRTPAETLESLDPEDARAWERLLLPFSDDWDRMAAAFLGPLNPFKDPFFKARFGLIGLRSADSLIRSRFRGVHARALFAGIAGHSFLPLDLWPTASFGLVLAATGHAVGWPQPEGGAQRVPDALASILRGLGGEIVTGWRVKSLEELPASQIVLLNLTPAQLLKLEGTKWPERYRRQLGRYRYGPGVFKVDWALREPIPWRAEECRRAGTVHVGGTFEEIAASERSAWDGKESSRPLVLVGQPSLFDPSRAPAGSHTAWAYCHVPNGSRVDMTETIELQIERFAPGFREVILARHSKDTAWMEAYDPNLVGGDINGGAAMLSQLFTRPVARLNPYSTPDPRVFLCSASTPPSGGVHGMCGHHSATSALRVVNQARKDDPIV